MLPRRRGVTAWTISGPPRPSLSPLSPCAPILLPPQHICIKNETGQPQGWISRFISHLEPRPAQRASPSQWPGLCQRRRGAPAGEAEKQRSWLSGALLKDHLQDGSLSFQPGVCPSSSSPRMQDAAEEGSGQDQRYEIPHLPPL